MKLAHSIFWPASQWIGIKTQKQNKKSRIGIAKCKRYSTIVRMRARRWTWQISYQCFKKSNGIYKSILSPLTFLSVDLTLDSRSLMSEKRVWNNTLQTMTQTGSHDRLRHDKLPLTTEGKPRETGGEWKWWKQKLISTKTFARHISPYDKNSQRHQEIMAAVTWFICRLIKILNPKQHAAK